MAKCGSFIKKHKFFSFTKVLGMRDQRTKIKSLTNMKKSEKIHPVLKSLKKGMKEVKLIQEGKLKATPLKDFLNKL